jgi:hypothetical protein
VLAHGPGISRNPCRKCGGADPSHPRGEGLEKFASVLELGVRDGASRGKSVHGRKISDKALRKKSYSFMLF